MYVIRKYYCLIPYHRPCIQSFLTLCQSYRINIARTSKNMSVLIFSQNIQIFFISQVNIWILNSNCNKTYFLCIWSSLVSEYSLVFRNKEVISTPSVLANIFVCRMWTILDVELKHHWEYSLYCYKGKIFRMYLEDD